MKCPDCGKTIPDTIGFCAYCGARTRPGLWPALLDWIRDRIGMVVLVASTAMFLGGLCLLAAAIIFRPPSPPSDAELTATEVTAQAPGETPTQRPTSIFQPPTSTQKPTRTPIRTPTPTASHTPSPTVAQPTPTPMCRLSVDRQLASGWDRSRLGCPTSQAHTIWAAWQPFQRGYMFWPSDTRLVAVFYDNRTWAEFPDQWAEGAPIPSRGNPPAGLFAPIRGFGYIWGSHDTVVNRIGWALETEKGFCANIQRFEGGLVFQSSTARSCEDESYNWARHPSFVPLFFSVYGHGTWQRW